MGESFAADAASMGYGPDWDGGWSRREDHVDSRTINEAETTLSKESVIEALIEEIAGRDSECWSLHDQSYRGEGEASLMLLDGATESSSNLHHYYFAGLGPQQVSARLLLEVLRTTGLPIFASGATAIWSGRQQCLRVHEHVSSSTRFPRSRGEHDYDPALVAHARKLLERAQLSTDHGLKPMLIHAEDAPRVERGLAIPRAAEEAISAADLDAYALAYFDRAGAVQLVPLKLAVAAADDGEGPICTRANTYDFRSQELRARLAEPRLATGAFTLAARHTELRFFSALPMGSVFQPYYYAQSTWSSRREIFLGGYREEAVAQAEELARLGEEAQSPVYLTAGQHPLDAVSDGLVTTPELYLNAVMAVYRCGFHITDHGPREIRPGENPSARESRALVSTSRPS